MSIILLSICICIIVLHTGYYLFTFNFFNFSKNEELKEVNIPVSVIVCAKNEAENLKVLIPKLIDQRYPDFEIILINDRSYDETANIYEEFALKHSFIKIVTIDAAEYFYGNKKYALTLGIKAAKNDCLLFTDADCIPKSNLWIQKMVNQFRENTQIVLGYGPYKHISNSFINKLIRYETLMTAIQYFSFSKIGIPYMGVGRNLMYSKDLFLKNKGFNQHIKIMSGDDDLLINRIASSSNTAICFDHNTFMESKSKTSIKEFITQKRRHISTAKYYKKKHQFILGLYAFNRLFFWIAFSLSFILINNSFYLAILYTLTGLKIISEYLVIGISASKLKEKRIIPFIPFLDLFLLLFQLYIYVCNTISKPKQWS